MRYRGNGKRTTDLAGDIIADQTQTINPAAGLEIFPVYADAFPVYDEGIRKRMKDR